MKTISKGTEMVKVISGIALVVALVGCGESNSKEVVVERTEAEVENGSIITLDENQTVGYKPNTDVNIVNIGDNSYYIECGNGSCPLNIDNSVVTDNSVNTTTTTTVDGSVIEDTNTTTDSNVTGG